MKKVFAFIVCLGQILFFSCNNDDKKIVKDCIDIACTEIFVTLTVTIKDESGVAIPLDSFKVIATANNEDLTRELSVDEFEMVRESGTYPLFGDEYAERYKNDSLNVLFMGFIDGDEVASAEFRVGADCCHVMLLAGDTNITIE